MYTLHMQVNTIYIRRHLQLDIVELLAIQVVVHVQTIIMHITGPGAVTMLISAELQEAVGVI